MGLRFDPVGGGQFKQAVKAIIDAESQPIKTLEARKGKEEQKLKLFQDFKAKFSGLDKALQEISSFNKLKELKADLGDGVNIAAVTLDKEKAQPGSYQIRVEQLAARSSIISNGFSDPNETGLGVGFVTMNLDNGEHSELFVDEKNSSLNGIAGLINQQQNSPVRAAVVRDSVDPDNPWKLIVTAKKEGEENDIEFPEFYFLDGEKNFYIDDTHESQNARIKVDGFPIELAGNDVADFLPGVNLHLKEAAPDKPFTLNITEDQQKIAGKMKGLVEQVNGVLQFISKQNSVDEKTDTSTTFAGDTGLQTLEYRLRNQLQEGFPVGNPDDDKFKIVHLNEVGIEFDKTGQLQFKEDKFNKAIEKDYNGVSEAISGQFGFAFQLGEVFKNYTRAGTGLLAIKEQGLRSRVKNIDDQITQKSRALDQKQQALVEKFARLESSLSNMQRQQQALSAMPAGGGGGGNSIMQLLGG